MRFSTCVHRASVLSLMVLSPVWACSGCYGPQEDVVMTRNIRRMQPDAQAALDAPTRQLEWGQLNFLHTTDTHGWLEGHLKEPNYGADWGDYKSFVSLMRAKAALYNVDLLLVDTGDLHDGAGLSDVTTPNGAVSNPIFEKINYDLLTIGNHELYVTEVAYETFTNFSKAYGDRYLTSNVQILNPATSQYEYIGKPYRYFQTVHGLRIMAFGFLFDFTGNSNVSKVFKAADVVKQQWFIDAVNYQQPVDLFVLLGHNPPRMTVSSSTFGTYYNAIRAIRPSVPIQVFGGHTHVRDFVVYPDGMGTGLESGRYCETLGWLSMGGITSSSYWGSRLPYGLPHPTRKAIPPAEKNATSGGSSTNSIVYARRYLDWNRVTFQYHTTAFLGKFSNLLFDTPRGKAISKEITADRKQLNLSALIGCAPQTWCISCAPFLSDGSIFSVLQKALSTVIVNPSRRDKARYIIINTGSVRFDLPKGPFTSDDSYIVSPFNNTFQYIADVPFQQADQILAILNKGPYQKMKRDGNHPISDFGHDFSLLNNLPRTDACIDPPTAPYTFVNKHPHANVRAPSHQGPGKSKIIRRQQITPGYTTTDDFGTDGDDTPHAKIPYYAVPNDLQANASFPTDGTTPETIDLIFLDFIQSYIINALNAVTPVGGKKYASTDVQQYLPGTVSANTYLPAYAKIAGDWQKDVPNCPVGAGIGSGS